MGSTSLQVYMDSSDWFQGTIQEETGMDSSSPSGITDPMLACSRPLMERRLRPQHDQALKCPRCDSTHTKFCYYNNYSLTQPRYFCKTCRRYWTKGGTLRNIPVGGGCRKNKKVSSVPKKSNHHHNHNHHNNGNNGNNLNNNNDNGHNTMQLSYPEFDGSSSLFGMGNGSLNGNGGFVFENLNGNVATRAIDFIGDGNQFMGMMGYAGEMVGANGFSPNFHGSNVNVNVNVNDVCSPFGGMSLENINGNGFMERGLIGYDNEGGYVSNEGLNGLDVKPKLLALEWQDQTGLGSGWGGLMNGYGPSSTNPLV